MNRVKVLLVDDHLLVRRGLRALLNWTEGVEVIGEAANSDEALDVAQRLKPDVVLTDIIGPRSGAAAAIDALLLLRPGTRIVALRGYDAEDHLLAAERSGALRYVSKEASSDELIRVIRRAAVSPEMQRVPDRA